MSTVEQHPSGPSLADPAWLDDPGVDFIDRVSYYSQEVLEAELDRLFARSWRFVCNVSELSKPGEYATTQVGRDRIVVLRDKSNQLVAFHNVCTHRSTELLGERHGSCGSAIKCPYHGWTFDLTGRLAAVPYPSGYSGELPTEKLGLVPAKVDVCGSLVFVATQPLVPSLAEFLGEARPWVEGLSSNLETIGRSAWIYEGNWKLWHDNFRDNYHPEFVHRLVHDLEAGYADTGANYWLEPGHSLLEWNMVPPNVERYEAALLRQSGISVNLAGNEEWQMGSGEVPEGEDPPPPPLNHVLALFPGFDLQSFGGGVTVQLLTPLTPGRTRIDISFMVPIGEPDEVRQFRLDHEATTQGSWGKVSADDLDVCVASQFGAEDSAIRYSVMSRGRAPGRTGETRDEYSLRSFYRQWRRYLYETPTNGNGSQP